MSTQIKNNKTRKKARRRLKPEVKIFLVFVLFLIALTVSVNLFFCQSETTGEEIKTRPTSEFSTEVEQDYVEIIEMTIKEAPTVELENIEEVVGVIPFGEFYITGYTPTCEHCCGKSDGITASGVVASVERTVAMHQIDMNNLGIEYGDSIYIEGIGERVVEDTGCRQGVIDVACASHEDCYKVTRYATVEVLGK